MLNNLITYFLGRFIHFYSKYSVSSFKLSHCFLQIGTIRHGHCRNLASGL